ncbi:hypothetical protein PISMIDRAFT_11647 [Pisolithus microcarpus 441]|uniref:Uncharacterized protein n=1 Tax=Pisolithus microcarpus 441 TaxID=765257 RepID=A0A0C9Z0F8_9AGAM|nr:hypothetical protein BKA83DRAFT_11647 [Pisolithus microcarpus]KIK22491.1 hypothetical protein PISMIDRAFT_11647 [Pisolithus microcarpus 441]
MQDNSAATCTDQDIQMATTPGKQTHVPPIGLKEIEEMVDKLAAAEAAGGATDVGTCKDMEDVDEASSAKDVNASGDEDMAADKAEAGMRNKDKGKGKEIPGSDEDSYQEGGQPKKTTEVKEKGRKAPPGGKKIVSAVRELPTTPVQELVDRIDRHVAQATLGYALMTVMDNSDLGRGPRLERQQVNLRNIDAKFMASFVKGVEEHGLKNRSLENALDIGIKREAVDLDSLRGAHGSTEPKFTNHVKWLQGATTTKATLYNGNHRVTYMQEHSPLVHPFNQRKLTALSLATRLSDVMRAPHEDAFKKADRIINEDGVWLVRFVDIDFIQNHVDRPFIETKLAGNQLLPTHLDSENDSFNTMMNILLQMPSAESRHKYIDTTLGTVKSVSNSNLAKLLRDKDMFDALFELFKYDHFRSRENSKSGLSMRGIAKWYPTYAGCMLYVVRQAIHMLDFLASPVDFRDVSKDIPEGSDVPTAFEAEYRRLAAELQKPISAVARKALDDKFFSDWTDQYLNHFHKGSGVNTMEYFASSIPMEQRTYRKQLEEYWDVVIRRAEAGTEVLPVGSTAGESDDTTNVIRASMPAKLKALKHGLMQRLHPQSLLDQFPIPNKMLLYALSKQLYHVREGITEVALWIEPFSMVAVDQKLPMWRDHVRGVENVWKEKLQSTSMDGFYNMIFRQRRRSLTSISSLHKPAQDKLDINTSLLGKEFVDSLVKPFIQKVRTELVGKGVKPSTASKQIALPAIEDVVESMGDMEKDQSDFLKFLLDILCHTSFPWMDPGRIKKPETLIIEELCEIGNLSEEWRWYDGIISKPTSTDLAELTGETAAMPLSTKETDGNMNIRTQRIVSTRKLHQTKLKQVVNAVLVEGLGLGAADGGKKMIPRVKEDLDRLLETLKVYSEMTIHRIQDPAVAFSEDLVDLDALGSLYPIDLPDAMSEKELGALQGRSTASGIRMLTNLAPYKDQTQGIWVAEKTAKEAEAKRQGELAEAFRKSKVTEAKASFARRLAAMKRQVKSAELVDEDDDDDDTMDIDDAQGGPSAAAARSKRLDDSLEGSRDGSGEENEEASHPSLKRTMEQAGHGQEAQSSRRPRLDISATDTSDGLPYEWKTYQDVISGVQPDITFKTLPGLLFLIFLPGPQGPCGRTRLLDGRALWTRLLDAPPIYGRTPHSHRRAPHIWMDAPLTATGRALWMCL